MNRIDDASEWQAQERALHDARMQRETSGDPLLAPYRHVARALRTPPPSAPPPGFAAQVAALAHAQAARVPADLRLEQRLLRGLVTLLALVAAVLAALQGPEWLRALDALLPGAASSWMLAMLACVGLSWSFSLLQREGVARG